MHETSPAGRLFTSDGVRDGELICLGVGPRTLARIAMQVWRNPGRQVNLQGALRNFEIHALDESMAVGRKLAESDTSDVIDAHLVVVAERLGTFVLTGDAEDMISLNARFETYS